MATILAPPATFKQKDMQDIAIGLPTMREDDDEKEEKHEEEEKEEKEEAWEGVAQNAPPPNSPWIFFTDASDGFCPSDRKSMPTSLTEIFSSPFLSNSANALRWSSDCKQWVRTRRDEGEEEREGGEKLNKISTLRQKPFNLNNNWWKTKQDERFDCVVHVAELGHSVRGGTIDTPKNTKTLYKNARVCIVIFWRKKIYRINVIVFIRYKTTMRALPVGRLRVGSLMVSVVNVRYMRASNWQPCWQQQIEEERGGKEQREEPVEKTAISRKKWAAAHTSTPIESDQDDPPRFVLEGCDVL